MRALLLSGLFILVSCQRTGPSPFEADTGSGTAFLTDPGITIGISVNGRNALEEAILFRQSDELTLIRSLGTLDIVSRFLWDSVRSALSVEMINPDEVPLNVERVVVRTRGWEMPPRGQVKQIASEAWAWRGTAGGDSVVWELPLRESPVILLPGEALYLPVIEFRNTGPDPNTDP